MAGNSEADLEHDNNYKLINERKLMGKINKQQSKMNIIKHKFSVLNLSSMFSS